jgi:hypothetical protein
MFPIIFGWNKHIVKQFGDAGVVTCKRCHNQSEWSLYRVQTWFTLFFIPAIPYENRYYVSCPICHSAASLTKSKFNELQEGNSRFVEDTKEEQAATQSTSKQEPTSQPEPYIVSGFKKIKKTLTGN